MYYLKMLLFTFLINTLVLPHYENCQNKHYNVSLLQNNTKKTTIKSRLLAQRQKHNPHYHNDPELKEMIDKLNEEAIKKYQQTHDPYKQLKEVVEKNRTKPVGGYIAEPMSNIEEDLLETYEEMFADKNHVTLKSGRYPNDDDKSNKSSCECTDINNSDLTKTKGNDKYLVNLKERCKGGIGFCTVGSILLTLMGFIAAGYATATYFEGCSVLSFILTILHCFFPASLQSVLKGAGIIGVADIVGSVPTLAMTAFQPYGIAALVLLILAVVLIILYIWLYRRRKNTWKHECKKHLCK
ncbi:stevor [Plasmodium reichenowi]|uniref:Stevor n=1 Tax=Plasmodium reichenowi TaxID=5854 RepID=A0A060RM44_PLARE|nr:stevor [Plasmodium reichenowi]